MSVTVVDGDLPRKLARVLRASGRVAVDTETSGLDWQNDELHLCQMFTNETGAVLLRNVDRRPVELGGVLGDPKVVKVFHFAPFDLRFLEARWEVRTSAVECTKAASRLLDPDLPAPAHTLQSLLARYLSIEVEKGAVRTSDWAAERLTDEQIAYATADVDQLLELSTELCKRLESEGKTQLFAEVCGYMPVDAHLAVSGIPNPLIY